MSPWKAIVGVIAVVGAMWWLYPSRQLDEGQQSPDVVEIFYMGPGGPVAGTRAELVREFERRSLEAHGKDPSKPVYRVISGQSAARNQVEDPTRFLVSVAGGVSPDVIWFDRYAVAEWAARGAFVPLDDYIRRDLGPLQEFAARFYRPCWDEATYKGQIYGIPASVDNRALYYNRDLLKRARLVYPDGPKKGQARPPETWEELKEYAVKLTETDAKGKLEVIGFPAYYGNSWLYMYGWMNGGAFMARQGAGETYTRCTLNDPPIVEALKFLVDVYDLQGGYQKAKAFEAGFQQNELDPFIQGKIAMKIDGVWVMARHASYGRDLNFGVAPNPMPERRIEELKAQGRKPAISWSGGWAYAIPTTAKHKQAAWEFIKFMTSDHAFRAWAENDRMLQEAQGRLYVPNQCPVKHLNEEFFRKYVLGNDRLPARFREGYRVFNDLLPYSRFRPVTPVGQVLWNHHRFAAEEALLGMEPKGRLDHHTKLVQRELNRVLNPPKGTVVESWSWFIVLYVFALIALGVLVFLWDTKLDFRRRLARLLRISGRTAESIIEGSRGGYFRRQWIGGVLCALPWILGFIILAGGPMLFSLVMSFCDYDVINPPKFVGLRNYSWMFTEDELFPKSLYNTAFMIIGVPLGMAVSLAVALLLNLKIRGMAAWRTFFYLPAIVPMVAASVLWIWIFNPTGGAINRILGLLGIKGPDWLASQAWSKPSLILMGLWGAGSGMIIWLAGLKGINQQLYEAASVDGAGAGRRFLHVTIPQLTPYIFFNLVMGTINTFQIFGQAFIMTQGGPNNSTLFYVYHLFNNAFRYGHMGYAAAMAWFLFAIIFLLTLLQMKLSKRWVYYEAE